jgi:hypothetical protein
MQGVVREIEEDREGRIQRFRREQLLDHGVKITANPGPSEGQSASRKGRVQRVPLIHARLYVTLKDGRENGG